MFRKLSVHSLTLVALVSVLSLFSQAQPQAAMTHHVRDVTVNGQAPLVGHLPSNQSLRLVLVLPHRNQAELEKLLKELYDPYSSSYRHFLTVEEFTELFGPTQEDYDSVISFAKANGFNVVGTSRNRTNLDVEGTVASIEKAFHLTMGVYQHDTENRTFFAPDREPMADMSIQLWRVAGLDNYATPKTMLTRRDANTAGAISNATTGSCPGKSFCGSDMRAAYYGGSLTGSGQSLGLFEFWAPIWPTSRHTTRTSARPTASPSLSNRSTPEHQLRRQQRLRRHRTDSRHDSGSRHGSGHVEPGDVHRHGGFGPEHRRCRHFQRHGHGQSAQRSVEQFMGVEADRPHHRRRLLPGVRGAGSEFVCSGRRQWHMDHRVGFARRTIVYVTSVGGTDLNTTGAGGAWASETGVG